MKEWKFKNGIEVCEDKYDHELHCFRVYNFDKYLGTIYPDTIEDMNNCIERLNDDNDPISDGWEDGMGIVCTFDGWGE